MVSGRDDGFFFKNIHVHREITKLQQPTERSEDTSDVRQLVIEDLPPVHKAAATGNVSDLKRLRDGGSDANLPLSLDAILSSPLYPHCNPLKFRDCTPLNLACWFGKLSSINALLERGADGHDPDRVFYTLVERGARIEYL